MSETTNSEHARARLPEGCECRLDFYMTSDTTGLEVVAGVSGMTSLPAPIDPAPAMRLVKSLGVATGTLEDLADDWRFMSRAEIADYKRRQDEDRTGVGSDDEDEEF